MLKRDHSMDVALKEMARVLQSQTFKVASGSMIKKLDFIDAFRSAKLFEGLSNKLLSQLYSVFDQNRRNLVQYVQILTSLMILNQKPEEENVLQLLAKIWDLYGEYCNDYPPIDRALAILTAGSAHDSDFNSAKALFKKDFEPTAFRVGVTINTDELLQEGMRALEIGPSKYLSSATALSSQTLPKSRRLYDPNNENSSFGASTQSRMFDLPVASVCGSSGLDRELFISILVSCTELLRLCVSQYRCHFNDLHSNFDDA
jgi:hypothetical protein